MCQQGVQGLADESVGGQQQNQGSAEGSEFSRGFRSQQRSKGTTSVQQVCHSLSNMELTIRTVFLSVIISAVEKWGHPVIIMDFAQGLVSKQNLHQILEK